MDLTSSVEITGLLKAWGAGDQAAVEQLTRSLMNKFLHAPLTGLRQSAHLGDVEAMKAIRKLFSREE